MRSEYLTRLKGYRFLLVVAVLSGFMVTGSSPAVAAYPGVQGETAVSPDATPEVAAVNPARANQGATVSLKITGKNFAQDAKVSFSNPGITTTEVKPKTTEIAVRIQVARDAEAGTGSLFVTNPNGRQAESPFEVAASQAPATVAKTTVPAGTEVSGAVIKYEVFNLGEGASILQNPNKPKGVLSVIGGKLKYEEAGKEVFSQAPSEIKEIEANSVLGYNTGTLHVILNSGTTYNFAPASLNVADGQKILDGLKRALH